MDGNLFGVSARVTASGVLGGRRVNGAAAELPTRTSTVFARAASNAAVGSGGAPPA